MQDLRFILEIGKIRSRHGKHERAAAINDVLLKLADQFTDGLFADKINDAKVEKVNAIVTEGVIKDNDGVIVAGWKLMPSYPVNRPMVHKGYSKMPMPRVWITALNLYESKVYKDESESWVFDKRDTSRTARYTWKGALSNFVEASENEELKKVFHEEKTRHILLIRHNAESKDEEVEFIGLPHIPVHLTADCRKVNEAKATRIWLTHTIKERGLRELRDLKVWVDK